MATDFTISPAVATKTSWDLQADGPMTVNGPGTWTITPTAAFSASVKLWGGGGGSGGHGATTAGNAGAGGNSAFSGLTANGGAGSLGCTNNTAGSNAAGGTASGGTTNTTGSTGATAPVIGNTSTGGSGGSSPNGGAERAGTSGTSGVSTSGAGGNSPGGGAGGGARGSTGGTATQRRAVGGGGGGGYVEKTYAPSDLTPSSPITLTVGGPGASGTGDQSTGASGAAGRATFTAPPAPFTPEQDVYRFFEDDTSEDFSTPIGTLNTALSRDVDADSSLQLRVRLQETAGTSGLATDDYQLQRSLNGGAFADVTSTSTIVKINAFSSLDDGSGASNRLGSGSGSYVSGEQNCTTGLITDRLLSASNFTEHVWGIILIAADLANADTITFRVLLNGSVITYNQTPTINVTKVAGGPTPITATLEALAQRQSLFSTTSLTAVGQARRTLTASLEAAAQKALAATASMEAAGQAHREITASLEALASLLRTTTATFNAIGQGDINATQMPSVLAAGTTSAFGGSGAQNTNLTPGLPLSFAGCKLILQVLVAASPTVSCATPSGWTLLHADVHSGNGFGQWLFAADHGASAPSIDWNAPDGTNTRAMARIYSILNADTSGSWSVAGNTNNATSTTLTVASLTTTNPDTLGLAFLASNNDDAFAVEPAGSTGGRWLEEIPAAVTTLGNDAAIQIQAAVMLTPGTISGGTMPVTAATTWITRTIGIKPLASGTPEISYRSLSPRPQVILDADLDSDIDDVVDALLLLRLEYQDELDIVAGIVTSQHTKAAPFLKTLFTHYGRGAVPIGANTDSTGASTELYLNAVIPTYAVPGFDDVTDFPDSVAVQRQALTDAAANSIEYITTGTLDSVKELLESGADGISGLTGIELVAAKAHRLWVVGGNWPQGAAISDFGGTGPRAVVSDFVLDNWPTSVPIIFVNLDDSDSGLNTGANVMIALSATNPARVAWEAYFGNASTSNSRPGWAQVAFLGMARGVWPNSSTGTDWWRMLGRAGTGTVNTTTGVTDWTFDSGQNRGWLRRMQAKTTFVTTINSMILGPPTLVSTVSATLEALAQQRGILATATLEAAGLTGRTATAQIDAAAALSRTIAATLDSTAQTRLSATATLDAVGNLLVLQAISSTLEALAQKKLTTTATIDAVASVVRTITTSLDAVAQKKLTVTAALDAVSKATRTAQASLDALARKQLSVGATFDSVGSAGTTDVFAALDAIAQARRSITATLEAKGVLAKQLTTSMNATGQRQITAQATLNAVSSLIGNVQATLNAIAQKSLAITTTFDAFGEAVIVAGQITATLEALAQARLTLTASMAAAGQTRFQIQASLDAVSRETKTATATLDALARATRTQTTALDSVAQAGRTLTANLDAFSVAVSAFQLTTSLDAVARGSRIATLSLDAAALKNLTVAASLEARGVLARTITANLDAAARAARTVTAGFDAAARAAQSATTTLHSAGQRAFVIQASIDAVAARIGLETVALDALALRQALMLMATFDAIVGEQKAAPWRGVKVPGRGRVIVPPQDRYVN